MNQLLKINKNDSKTHIQWIALLNLCCYFFLLFHPIIGHFDELFPLAHKFSSLHQQIIQTSQEHSHKECMVCQQIGSITQVHLSLPALKFDLNCIIVLLPYISGFIPDQQNHKISPRAPPIFI